LLEHGEGVACFDEEYVVNVVLGDGVYVVIDLSVILLDEKLEVVVGKLEHELVWLLASLYHVLYQLHQLDLVLAILLYPRLVKVALLGLGV